MPKKDSRPLYLTIRSEDRGFLPAVVQPPATQTAAPKEMARRLVRQKFSVPKNKGALG